MRKAELCDVIHEGINITIRCRVLLSQGEEPVIRSTVKVEAKPIKTEYESTIHSINNWITREAEYPYMTTILNPANTVAFTEKHAASQRRNPGMQRRNFVLLRNSLNDKQVAQITKHTFCTNKTKNLLR